MVSAQPLEGPEIKVSYMVRKSVRPIPIKNIGEHGLGELPWLVISHASMHLSLSVAGRS